MLALSILLPTAWMAHFGRLRGFVFDDLRNFRDVQLEGLSLRYLLDPVGDVYFAPGHRLGNWVVHRFFPMDVSAARAFTIVTFAACLLVLYLVLAELSCHRSGSLVLTALYGLSVIHVAVGQWWTSALQILPATLFSFLCILLYLRFHRTRRVLLLALSVGALCLGMLFHSRVAYVAFYLLLIRVLLLEPDRRLWDTVKAAMGEWRVWLAYAVPAIVFSAAFLSMFSGSEPSLRSLLEYLSLLWLRVFVPGLFGGLIRPGPLSTLELVGMLAAQVVLVGTAAWTLLRVPGAWRGWALFAVAFLVNAIPIGLTRIDPTALNTVERAAYGLRYNVESMYLFIVAVAFLLPRWHRSRSGPGHTVWWLVPGVASLGFLGYLALALDAARLFSGPDAIGAVAGEYAANVQESLDRIGYSTEAAAFADGVVPQLVVFYVLAPSNTVSEVLPVIDDRVSFDVAGRTTLRVADDGSIEPVVFRSEEGGDVRDLLQRGSLAIESAETVPSQSGLCIRTGEHDAGVVFTPARVLLGDDFYVALRYSSRSRRPVALAVEPFGGGGPGPYTLMMLKDDGEQTNLFPIEGETLRRLYVGLFPRSELCLNRLEVGQVSTKP